ncbi:PadR family transcriptional regulator [Sphingomonas sp.]|jgi:DNA-binding PadR family transcriptional regulator|uniref:PadR family transcriptional regulator n=1 Tax=Sphingomonas sp. TaxID=28214 RepID=UPI002D7F3BFB|nr:PadR family transcriptional regulator [Sphingomonas sp.]HEU0045050.1 PadR family transcriptional regulator [Sphingomonas sp.]
MHFSFNKGNCGPRGGRWQRGPVSVEWSGFERVDGRPGGRQRRMFDGGELRLVLLKLIADQPRHGYDLIREIEELTGGAYAPSPGVVYPTLTLLDEMGQIGEQQSEGAKKRFAVTEAGREELAAKRPEVDALIARLTALGAHRERSDRGPVRRAMGNLGQAVGNRVARGDFSDETLHDIAALIDEVAQKIERLR